jgi:hypothetical protein
MARVSAVYESSPPASARAANPPVEPYPKPYADVLATTGASAYVEMVRDVFPGPLRASPVPPRVPKPNPSAYAPAGITSRDSSAATTALDPRRVIESVPPPSAAIPTPPASP